MSAEFGAPVDVVISSESQTNGETIINIPLGAVFKFLRHTSEWSKEDYVGPVLVVKPTNSDDYLDIQLFNRRSVNNIKLQFYKNSGYHRNDNIIMMKARDGTVYGLASNSDYCEQLNLLEKKLKEFTTTFVCDSDRTYSPFSQHTDTSSPIGDCISSSSTSFFTPCVNQNDYRPLHSTVPQSPFSTTPTNQISPKSEKASTKWNTQMIPASVYRRAAAPKNGLSRPSSVAPVSVKEDRHYSINSGLKPQNLSTSLPQKQNNTNLDGFSTQNTRPQNSLLSKATASVVTPNDRMEAILELIRFAYEEGLKKGAKRAYCEDKNRGLVTMPTDQLLSVLEDVLSKKPDVKKKLFENFSN